MIRYTLGFIFNESLSKVLLMHKLTPAWQKGMVNGLGGKFEANESCYDCVAREILEEASLVTHPDEWLKVGELRAPDWEIDVLSLVYPGDPNDAQAAEDEAIEWFPVFALPPAIKSNLSWLVPLCHDAVQNQEFHQFKVEYKACQ